MWCCSKHKYECEIGVRMNGFYTSFWVINSLYIMSGSIGIVRAKVRKKEEERRKKEKGRER
ncbi:MAG: hypothetical protein F6K39_33980, partial [Okeania sp. SIO3B3]|nr:hypothetical protein [Okeania sp. SIO3B3]